MCSNRIAALALTGVMVLGLVACSPTDPEPTDTSTPEVTEPADTSEPEQTATAEPDDQEPQETGSHQPRRHPQRKHLPLSLFSNPPRSNSKRHRHQSFRVMAVETLILGQAMMQARAQATRVVQEILEATPAA